MKKLKTGYRYDPRSTDDLIHTALISDNDDTYMFHVELLRYRCTEEVIEKAIRLCVNENPKKRELGADILGVQNGLYEEKCNEILISLLQDECSDVIEAALISIAIRKLINAINPILKLRYHPNAGVRFSVAYAIGAIEHEHLSEEILYELKHVLISMSSDVDSKVRLEATNHLVFCEIKTNNIIDALLHRVNDEDAEIRAAALLGLADKRYKYITDLLIHELSTSEYICDDTLDAAGRVADARLLPILTELKQEGIDKKLGTKFLDEAIDECNQDKNPNHRANCKIKCDEDGDKK